MRKYTALSCLVIASMIAGGCSTRPRNFVAQISTPVTDNAMLENDYRTCSGLVQAGHTSNFRGAAISGAATSAGALGTAAGMTMGGVGALGSYAAATLAIPVVGVLAGFGVSRMIRGGRERRARTAMTECLAEYGYEVADWERIDRHEDASALVASRLVIPTQAGEASEAASLPEGEADASEADLALVPTE